MRNTLQMTNTLLYVTAADMHPWLIALSRQRWPATGRKISFFFPLVDHQRFPVYEEILNTRDDALSAPPSGRIVVRGNCASWA